MNFLSLAYQYRPATEPSVHSLILDDLATKILQTFISRCATTSPTTYPKIAARGPMQLGSNSSWLLPRVCKHLVHTTRILIVFLLSSEIFLMHQLHRSMFFDVLIISLEAFTEFGHDSTMNVNCMQTTTP
jgi:hypothetical protein